ncbi:MAG: hypothetical protein CM1200mP30_14020 [Pseudomonadota bacterium]|nr:MAG: hypothetical protein CM1200mP30_14020 [Pseudomonadota bacterium]
MFDFAGPVKPPSGLDWFGVSGILFPSNPFHGGQTNAVLVLYPYVYLLGRSTFLEQSVGLWKFPYSGLRTLDRFLQGCASLSEAGLVTGLSLALMETLADYGTVAYFGLGVFTTGIFRTWFGLGDYTSAAKLAALLMLFVFALIIMERFSRNKAQYHNSSGKLTRFSEYRLQGFKAWGAFAICTIPIFLGFFLPAAQLSLWALETWSDMVDDSFFRVDSKQFFSWASVPP